MENWKKQFDKIYLTLLIDDGAGLIEDETDKRFRKKLKQFIQELLDEKDKEWQKRCKEGKILTADVSFEAGRNQQDGLRTHFFKRIK